MGGCRFHSRMMMKRKMRKMRKMRRKTRTTMKMKTTKTTWRKRRKRKRTTKWLQQVLRRRLKMTRQWVKN